MVDRTVYKSKEFTPQLALRNVFGRHHVPAPVCLLFADNDLLDVGTVAVMGDSFATVRQAFTRLVGGEPSLGADDRAREHALLRVVAIWQSCNELERHSPREGLRWKRIRIKFQKCSGKSL